MSKQEKKFTGEIGIHYPLHVLNRYSLPELIGLAETAWRTMEQFGFSQVWTNDNLEYRSVLASSAAIVARLPVKLGTAVTVPYFRNPVDLAMAFATMSELMDGREISLGLGPGSQIDTHASSGTGEAAHDHGGVGDGVADVVRRRGAKKQRHARAGVLFSYERGTIRASLQNPIADPTLLWTESAQTRGARSHRAPLRRRDPANSLWHRRYGSVAGASASGASAIAAGRAAAQSHAAQRVGFARRRGGQAACQKIRLAYRFRLAG